MPRQLQTAVELVADRPMNDVRVIYSSPEPRQMNAAAYTFGRTVVLGPGQERHLHHELGHVVQQTRTIVSPSGSIRGVPYNNDASRERGADEIAEEISRNAAISSLAATQEHSISAFPQSAPVLQFRLLHAIGEHHLDSDARVDYERQYCLAEFGEGYWLEQEFSRPGETYPADSRVLRATYDAIKALYRTPDLVTSIKDGEDFEDNRKFADDLSTRIVSFETEYEGMGLDNRHKFERDRLIKLKPGLDQLYESFFDFKMSDGQNANAHATLIQQCFESARDSIVILHRISESSERRALRELTRSRSDDMAQALAEAPESETGVWKVGEHHINEMEAYLSKLEEDENDAHGRLVHERNFNQSFLAWFQRAHPEAHAAYMVVRNQHPEWDD